MINHGYQLKIKSIVIARNGKSTEYKGHNLLSVTIAKPHIGAESIESIKKFDLVAGKKKKVEGFSDQILHKFMIQGDSSISIKLTAVEEVKKVKTILKALFKAGAITILGTATGGSGITIVSGIAKSFIESALEWNKPKNKISIIGEAELEIDNSLDEGTISMELKVPKKIKLVEYFKKDAEGNNIPTYITLDKGFKIGKVILEVKKIPVFTITNQLAKAIV